jgi:AraC-like DNA-binding protein
MDEKLLSKFYLYQQIVNAKLFIDSNFAENINIDKIAAEAFFSKYHFIRLFKIIYNKTPHQYLITVRIEKAKLLLQSGTSVSEACNAVGFESISSFSILFKQMTSHSPSSYKKIQSERQSEIKETPLKFIPHCVAKQYKMPE